MVLGIALVVGMFFLATLIGGDTISDRFFGIIETGVTDSYRRNRGIFLEYTLTDLLNEYPLGAGAGRHGMMYVYFAPLEGIPSPSVHAEIQLTAWLVDGGFPLMICYSGAIVAVMWAVHGLAVDRRRPNSPTAPPSCSVSTCSSSGSRLRGRASTVTSAPSFGSSTA